jgi:ankyrin repeat protein
MELRACKKTPNLRAVGAAMSNILRFLLPALQIQTVLEKLTPAAIREALRVLSKDLNTEFEAALGRIQAQSEERRSLAMTVLLWISTIQGVITVSALRHAISVKLGETGLDYQNLTPLKMLTSSITDFCQGLVRIEPESSSVHLVHYSLMQYLQSEGEVLFPIANEIVARTCLTYLLFDSFGDGPSPDDASFEELNSKYPFFIFASQLWGFHSHRVIHQSNSMEIVELCLQFIRNPSNFEAANQGRGVGHTQSRQAGYSQLYSHGMSGIHAASLYGLATVLNRLLDEDDADINSTVKSGYYSGWNVLHFIGETIINDDSASSFAEFFLRNGAEIVAGGYGQTPLHIAAGNGRLNTCRVLLDAGADVLAVTEYGWTAFHSAGRNGNVVLLQLLIQHGAEVCPEATSVNKAQTPLILAVANSNEQAVRFLLEQGADPNEANSDGLTPLYEAALVGSQSLVRLLIEKGANVNEPNYISQLTPVMGASKHPKIIQLLIDLGAKVNLRTRANDSALLFAAQAGSLDSVVFLLDNGAELNGKYEVSDTALIPAVAHGHISTVRLLVERGIELNAVNDHGNAALHLATENEEIVRILLEAGADVNIRSKNGGTPLYLAASSISKESDAVVESLLQHNADVNAVDDEGVPPLVKAILVDSKTKIKTLLDHNANVKIKASGNSSVLLYAVKAMDDLGTINTLLGKGAEVNDMNDYRTSILHGAVQGGHEPIVRLILEKGASVSIHDQDEDTPIHFAAESGSVAVTGLLLEHGADIQSKGFKGALPLSKAAAKGKLELVRYLLDHGADVSAVDDFGAGAIVSAAEAGSLPVVKLLLDNGANINSKNQQPEPTEDGTESLISSALILAAQNGYPEVVRLLLDRGAAFTLETPEDYSPLHASVGQGHISVVEVILRDKSINLNIANRQTGITPLKLAVLNDHQAIASLLLEKGAEVDAISKLNMTPLVSAARCPDEDQSLRFTRLLLDHGADITLRAIDGNTALHMAGLSGHVSVAKLLLDRGADVNSNGEFDGSPLYMAAYASKRDLVQFLLENGADPNQLDDNSKGPLHQTSEVEIGQLLLDHGALVDRHLEGSRTPLFSAASRCDQPMARFLLERGANINHQISSGLGCLMDVIQSESEESEAMLELLLQNGASTELPSKDAWTVLHLVVYEDNFPCTKILLKHGADINAINSIGLTPLHLAAMGESTKMVQLLMEKTSIDSGLERNLSTSVLSFAAVLEDLTLFNWMLEKGADLEVKDKYGRTPLIYCAQSSKPENMTFLLDAGADITASDDEGTTALGSAVHKSHEAGVRLLLERGSDIITRHLSGTSIIQVAAETGNLNITQMLLEKGADIKVPDKNKVTALHNAVVGENIDIVRLFLEKEAVVDAKDAAGQTSLLIAACTQQEAVVRLLVDYGANVNAKQNEGSIPLHFAAMKGDTSIINFLIEKGAEINTCGYHHRTPLMQAAMKDQEEAVRTLLQRPEIDLTLTDEDGWNVLGLVVGVGRFSMVKQLVAAGIDVNANESMGKAALPLAAEEESLEMVQFLVSHGANINASGYRHRTALVAASAKGNEQIVRYLLGCKRIDLTVKDVGQLTALHLASGHGHLSTVKLLVAAGADMESKSNRHNTPLSVAATQGQVEVVRFLAEAGAIVDSNNSNDNTPFHHAVTRAHAEVILVLLEKGADLEHQDKQGDTALMNACAAGSESIVHLLLDHGADISATNETGMTALFRAAEKGKESVIPLLLERGADVTVRDKVHKTALHWAVAGGNVDVLELLLKCEAPIDREAKDEEGNTAYAAAEKLEREDMMKLLDHTADHKKKNKSKHNKWQKVDLT